MALHYVAAWFYMFTIASTGQEVPIGPFVDEPTCWATRAVQLWPGDQAGACFAGWDERGLG